MPEKMCSHIKSVNKSGLLWPRLNTCGKKLVLQRPWKSSHWFSLGQEFTLLFSRYRMWRWHYILMKDTCRSTHMAVLLHFCLFNGNCLRNNMKKLRSNALLFLFFSSLISFEGTAPHSFQQFRFASEIRQRLESSKIVSFQGGVSRLGLYYSATVGFFLFWLQTISATVK